MNMFSTKDIGEPRFLRAGLFGAQGSGKSFTALKLGMGLSKQIGSKKPIAMFDTENGSAWLKPFANKYGVELAVCKTTSYNKFVLGLDSWHKDHDILIIDSIVHYFESMVAAYLRANNWYKTLPIHAWGELKPKWKEDVTRKILNAPGHVILCSRQSQVWKDIEEDGPPRPDGTQKTKAIKTGDRPAGDSQLGYEVDLLIHMTKEHTGSGGYEHVAKIVKDKNCLPESTLEGKEFSDPGYKEFLPHIEALGLTGGFVPVVHDNKEEVFESTSEEKSNAWSKKAQRDAAYEGIVNIIKEIAPRNQKVKNSLLEALFGTNALDTEIKDNRELHNADQLLNGLHCLRKIRDMVNGGELKLEDMGHKKVVEIVKSI